MGLFFMASHGVAAGLVGGAMSGVLYGVAMTAFLGVSQVVSTSRGGKTKADLGVRQKRTFAVLGDRQAAFEQVKVAFQLLGVKQFDIEDAETGVLTGHTSWTFKSFGENLSAVVKQGVEVCEVTVTSEPRLPTTLVDYGKNRENIDAIEQRLLSEWPSQVEVRSQEIEAHQKDKRVVARQAFQKTKDG